MTRLRTIISLAVLAGVVSIALAPMGQASTETPLTTCGQVITTNAFLTRDLTCPGLAGVVVGASRITINLNGFTLRGDHSAGRYGIDDLSGFDEVTVENGSVRDFDYGVVGFGADRLLLSDIDASQNTNGGIFIAGVATQIQSSGASGNGGDGVYIMGTSASVRSFTAIGNAGSGIYVSGAFSRIRLSAASRDGSDGIVVVGNAARLESNWAEANGRPESLSGGARLGIHVFGYTVVPTGTNIARDNSDPAQCRPKSLC